MSGLRQRQSRQHPLLRQLRQRADRAVPLALRIPRIFAEVSIIAQPFFERCGFSVIQQQVALRGGIALTNFRMEKRLKPLPRGPS
jgi:hypothetical protein